MRNRKFLRRAWLAMALGGFACGVATAQQDSESVKVYSPAELEELVGPVALYPDDLLAIILPASTYPLQVVQATRYLTDHEQDSSLAPSDDWDDAVVALLNYPEIVDFMNEDLDWTWTLGEAVINQQPDVINAIQQFRERAYAAGNLKSDDHQLVSRVDGVIKIERVEPEVIYVPHYEPERVIVYQSEPVYDYYPYARPVYYYPYPAYYSFTSGFFWGITTFYAVGWLTDGLFVHHYGHFSHPYFGHLYHNHFNGRHHVNTHRGVAHERGRHSTRGVASWQPGRRHGARPRHGKMANRDHRTVASDFDEPRSRRRTDGRRSDTRTNTRVAMLDRSRNPSRNTSRNTRHANNDESSSSRNGRRSDTRTNTRVAMLNRSQNPSRNTSRNTRHANNDENRSSRKRVNRNAAAAGSNRAGQSKQIRTPRRANRSVDVPRSRPPAPGTNRQPIVANNAVANNAKAGKHSHSPPRQSAATPKRTRQAQQPSRANRASGNRKASRSDVRSNSRGSRGGGKSRGNRGRGGRMARR